MKSSGFYGSNLKVRLLKPELFRINLISKNMKRKVTLILLALLTLTTWGSPSRKVIDEGGSGPYKAEAVSESTLPDFTIYRPADLLGTVTQNGPLPLIVFANGACNDTSLPYERMLSDLSSYGYLVVALGEMQDSITDRELHKSPTEDMIRAIDWAESQNKDADSPYFKKIDMEYVGLAGHSCGGAQVLANCADERVKTCILFNSGMGEMEMAGASKESLKNLHCPILYILGGDTDIAYKNALADYGRIDNVPVAFANQLRVGHDGTFHDQYGGSYSRMLRAWLSWQFKDQRNNIDIFLRNRMNEFPDYTMMAKNFPDSNEPFTIKEIHCKARDGKDIWGRLYLPESREKQLPIVIMAHGYNGTHLEPQPFAESLAMRGVASYIFDFCGGGNNSKSEGLTTEMTLFTERDNVEDITEMVKSWDFIDPNRVSLLGCSQGGLVAALTASATPDAYKSLILVYPAFTIPATAPMMLKRFDADNGKPQDVMGMKLGREYYDKINGMNVFDSIKNYKGEVFLVYGDKDMIVAGGVDKAKENYEKCNILMIPGGDHGFSNYRHHEEATGGIVDFAIKTLSKPRERWHPEFDATNPDVHDPVVAKENGKYYMFTTGWGVGLMSSQDLKTWKLEESPLNPIPEWAMNLIPAYKGHTWAPDLIKVGDKWWLYYSCSTFGKNISAIGVACNKTLDSGSPDYRWEDQGMVIMSEPGKTDWNAIDPNVIMDENGDPWLTFGSFWDGIQLVKLKKDMKTCDGEPVTIARRRNPDSVAHLQPTANTNAVEAPFITYKDGYYYLFVSYDYCCKGINSNYKTAVGRSKSVAGPYIDKEGKDMAETGGTVLVAEDADYSGVGHCSVYEFDGKWYIVAHGYDKRRNGASKLYIRELNWKDGWPEIVGK